MTPDQTIALSNFLNSQANLPVDIQAIADSLKATVSPIVESAPIEDATPSEEVAPIEDTPSSEVAPIEDAAPSEE